MHDAGCVHRDLKPANVMWLPRANRWTLIDFGCVARVGQQAPLQFTVAYAAPEIIRSFFMQQCVVEATPALDAWSLGVMAFELLTGAPAFDILADGRARVWFCYLDSSHTPSSQISLQHEASVLGGPGILSSNITIKWCISNYINYPRRFRIS